MAGFYRSWSSSGSSSGASSRLLSTVSAAVIAGVSVWCAAGDVSVLSGQDASLRLLVPAPWWVAVLAALVGSGLPGWRRRPLAAVPALLATVPWWPVPVPAVALMWTGPLAWMPIAVAVLCAEGDRLRAGTRWFAGQRGWGAALVGSVLIAGAALWTLGPRLPGGDEPHYLVITQSLLQDGDLQIENNHASRDYATYFGGTIAPDYLVRGQNGAIYSIHAPGVSALVLPAFAVAGLRGAQFTLVLLFGITGALIWSAAFRLTDNRAAAWFAWLSIAGSTTMAVLSVMVFPDAPGACAVAAGVWLLAVGRRASMRALVGVSAMLAVLPWLHTRFAVLAGLLGVAIMAWLLLDADRTWRIRLRRVVAFLALPVLSAIGWFTSFWLIYGTVDPRVPYGANPELRSWIWGAVAGLFVDQQFGLLTYAPVLGAGFLGLLVRGPREWRLRLAACLAMLLTYAMAVASYWMWWAGVPGLPARFLTAALPLLALPLAVVWARTTQTGRNVLLGLLGVSVATTTLVLTVDHGVMAWNPRDGQSAWFEWLSPLVNLPRGWPSFFWQSEGQFLWHVVALVLVAGVAWLGVRQCAASRRLPDDGRRAAAGLTALASVMAMTWVGWMVTGSAPLDPTRTQMAVHAAAGQGHAVWVSGAGLHRWDPAAEPLVVTGDEAPLADRPTSTVLSVADVPAGLYRISLAPQSDAGASTGVFRVRLGRSAELLGQIEAQPASPTSAVVRLPAGAVALVVEAATPEQAAQWSAVLRPEGAAWHGDVRARSVRTYGTLQVFFLDTNVFDEAEGFWVRGARTTAVVLSGGEPQAGRTGTVHLRNGGADNVVTLASGPWREVVSLAPWEEHDVALPVADAHGRWPLSVTSSGGFQPSVVSGGDDTRFLGVWVH